MHIYTFRQNTHTYKLNKPKNNLQNKIKQKNKLKKMLSK